MTTPEYIERESIGLNDFEIILCEGDYKEALKMLLDKIESIPAADVREVNRAKWREGVYAGYRCSLCKTTWDAPTNFCPNCGADMREVEADAIEGLSKPRWISVEEVLPERDKNVLVFSKHSGLIYIDANIQFDRNVTHWMPLPEPPKEGS